MEHSNPLPDTTYVQPGAFEETRYERLHTVIFNDSQEGSVAVANEIAHLIREKERMGEPCVLGLATGSSPIKVYEELVRLHREEGLSFRNVITFNLDEYFPMPRENEQSYYYFMHLHLFNHIDIDPANVHIPDGTVKQEEVRDYCLNYEQKIEAAGGLDFQLLGIGRTGHIGFNEPGSHVNSRTRMITLDHLTRVDASAAFFGVEYVPRKAITMGIGTIRKARRIVLLAWGNKKAPIIQRTVEQEMVSQVPATYLQEHPHTTLVIDQGASSELTRIKMPWIVGNCEWNEDMQRKAIIWLCEQVQKPFLKLTDKDYNDYGMDDLLAQEGTAYDLNIRMFNHLQHTITGWPGGKPHVDDTNRPERAHPASKRVLVFSPHPDDDVISMGGTLDRLVEQGHEVHIAYQTSGNIGVSNEEALKYVEVSADLLALLHGQEKTQKEDFFKASGKGKKHAHTLLELKRLIREKESLAAMRFLNIPEENVHFLKMPFYETGSVIKNKLAEADIRLVENMISTVKPHQIYAAGDLSDPHGTHKTCMDALRMALDNLKGEAFMNDCWVWLYSGAWDEWKIYEVNMAVPMSPDQVSKKRNAILFHQSQKDRVMFQGNDSREFWVRAEERNRHTAQQYHDLGLAEYAALEAFKRMQY